MEIPSKVTIFNRTLELKGKQATLIAISPAGYYEITMEFQAKLHTVLFPIAETTIIVNEAHETIDGGIEVER